MAWPRISYPVERSRIFPPEAFDWRRAQALFAWANRLRGPFMAGLADEL
jgi:hypothetical protein